MGPEYSLEQIELVCKDKDAWGPLFNKTSRPRDDDETVESLWSDWDIPRRMMQVALWIKEKNEETGEWESTFWKMLEESKCDDWSFQGHTIWWSYSCLFRTKMVAVAHVCSCNSIFGTSFVMGTIGGNIFFYKSSFSGKIVFACRDCKWFD